MKEYKFYGWQTADVSAVNKEYKEIKDPRHLYDLLAEIWCADTCAPRMRDGWSKENMTLGQCSITAFLAQDSANAPVAISTCEASSIIR